MVSLLYCFGRNRSVLFHIYSPVVVDADRPTGATSTTPSASTFLDHRGRSLRGDRVPAIRFPLSKSKEGRQGTYNPENKKLEWWLTIVTAIGVGPMFGAWPSSSAPVSSPFRPDGS